MQDSDWERTGVFWEVGYREGVVPLPQKNLEFFSTEDGAF